MLDHARRVEALLKEGRKAEAARLHNEHLAAEMDRARGGNVINLSDLMAAKDALVSMPDEAA